MPRRPYRALCVGSVILWTVLGVATGVPALLGSPRAMRIDGRAVTGLPGLAASIGFCLALGAVIMLSGVASLWLGTWLERRRTASEPPAPTAAT